MDLDKKSLRAEFLAARESLAAEVAGRAAEKLASLLIEIIPASVEYVAGYLSHRNEINVLPAMERFAARGQKLCLPVIVREQAPLAFRGWQPGGALEKGLHGIDIPLASEPPVMPGAVLVPLVAFDASGHRLGYGMGYYDRTIRRLREAGKDVQIIGVAYGIQQAGLLPGEPHDELLDVVVTEKTAIQFS